LDRYGYAGHRRRGINQCHVVGCTRRRFQNVGPSGTSGPVLFATDVCRVVLGAAAVARHGIFGTPYPTFVDAVPAGYSAYRRDRPFGPGPHDGAADYVGVGRLIDLEYAVIGELFGNAQNGVIATTGLPNHQAHGQLIRRLAGY